MSVETVKERFLNGTLKRGLFIFYVTTILLSCDKKEVDRLNNQLSISESKVSILQNSSAGNLITKIDSTSNSITVMYENGFIAHIPKNYFTSIEANPAQWQTLFSFTDGSFINASCIGQLNLKDSIIVNPFGTNPLCALAKFRFPVQGKFNVIVHGKPNGGIDISHYSSNYSYDQQLPVLGLYDNYPNQVEFQFFSSNGVLRATQVVTLPTDAVPNKPTLTIKKNLLSATDVSIYSLSASGPWGFDQKGEIRWYYSGDFFWSYGKLKNGNLIVSSAINTKIGQMSPSLNEISMLGEVVRTYSVPNFQTHDVVEMPNGNLLIGTNSSPSWGNNAPELDAIAEIDRHSGDIIKTWDFNTILDPTRLALPDSGVPNDWVHINSVFYNSNDNSIIVSCRSQSAVVKIDYSTSQIKWILSNHNYWNAQLAQYLLTPVDAKGNQIGTDTIDFWPYGQHNATQLQNGNVMLYDDGDYRGYYDNQNAPLKSYTRGVEYKLDEKNMTIQLFWSFDNNKSIFTQYTGSITQFDVTNTRMIGYMDGATNSIGESPKILEIDNQNNVVFEANVNLGKFYYRALKMDLYSGLR